MRAFQCVIENTGDINEKSKYESKNRPFPKCIQAGASVCSSAISFSFVFLLWVFLFFFPPEHSFGWFDISQQHLLPFSISTTVEMQKKTDNQQFHRCNSVPEVSGWRLPHFYSSSTLFSRHFPTVGLTSGRGRHTWPRRGPGSASPHLTLQKQTKSKTKKQKTNPEQRTTAPAMARLIWLTVTQIICFGLVSPHVMLCKVINSIFKPFLFYISSCHWASFKNLLLN